MNRTMTLFLACGITIFKTILLSLVPTAFILMLYSAYNRARASYYGHNMWKNVLNLLLALLLLRLSPWMFVIFLLAAALLFGR